MDQTLGEPFPLAVFMRLQDSKNVQHKPVIASTSPPQCKNTLLIYHTALADTRADPANGHGCACLLPERASIAQLSTTLSFASELTQVWLLQDRLCYGPVSGSGNDIHYIPLDRITVRPLPRGYKPRIGVASVDHSLVSLLSHFKDDAATEQTEGRVFSVQYGLNTVYWAADNSHDAKASGYLSMPHALCAVCTTISS